MVPIVTVGMLGAAEAAVVGQAVVEEAAVVEPVVPSFWMLCLLTQQLFYSVQVDLGVLEALLVTPMGVQEESAGQGHPGVLELHIL